MKLNHWILILIAGILISACQAGSLTPPISATGTIEPGATAGSSGSIGYASTAVSAGGSSQTAVVMPTSTVPAAPAGVDKVITSADQNRTITLKVGQRVMFFLDAIYTWQITSNNPAVLAPGTGSPMPAGAVGLFEALAPGNVSLSASGDPACRLSKPACMMPSILLEFNFIVK